MPFFECDGDCFSTPADVVVNTANCVGIMGAGVAKAVAARWPVIRQDFRTLCGQGLSCDGTPDPRYGGKREDLLPPCLVGQGLGCAVHRVAPGRVLFRRTQDPQTAFVAHLATKRHWNTPSRLDDVAASLQDLGRALTQNRSKQPLIVALPAPGCSHGGLSWSDVRPLIHAHILPPARCSHHTVLAYCPKS